MDFTSSSGTTYSGRGGSFGSDFYKVASKYLILLSDANFTLLDTVKNNYLETLSLSKEKVNGLDYSKWNDSISKKLISYTDDLKNTRLDIIENDLISGNFIVLIKELKKLRIECENYKNEEEKKIILSFRNETDRIEYNKNNNTTNLSQVGKEDLNNHNSRRAQQKENLVKYETVIKSIVATINGITFLGEVSSNLDNTTPTNSVPSGWETFGNYYKVPYSINGKEGFWMIIDPKTGNRVVEDGHNQWRVYKTDEDGVTRCYMVLNDNNAPFETAKIILSDEFDKSANQSGYIFNISDSNIEAVYAGSNVEVVANSIHDMKNYVVNVDGISITIPIFPGDASMHYFENMGF